MSIGDGSSFPYPSPVTQHNMWEAINKEQVMRDMLSAQAMVDAGNSAAMAQQAGTYMPPVANTTNLNLAGRAREMFLKRMGGLRAELKVAPGDFVQCHIHHDMVFVFYCFNGREGCAKEAIDLFPSDTLITQFRLVLA
jgi:hypothetical protein